MPDPAGRAGPADINANGHIFGGWVLSQMDIAAGIVASRRAKGAGRDGRDRGDGVHCADPPARPGLGLRRGRADREDLDGGARSRSSRTATSARPRSRSPKACSRSWRSTRTTVRVRSIPTKAEARLSGGRGLVVAGGGAGSPRTAARLGRLVRSLVGLGLVATADRRRQCAQRHRGFVRTVGAAARCRPFSPLGGLGPLLDVAILGLLCTRFGAPFGALHAGVRRPSLRYGRSRRGWRSGRSSCSDSAASASDISSSPSSPSSSSLHRASGADCRNATGPRRARGNNGPHIADNIRSGRGRPRAGRRAPCSCISREAARHCPAGDYPGDCPGCPPWPRCPPRPRLRPP